MTFAASSGVAFLMLCAFAILAIGYLVGRITIKGISLGSAGVFIVALLFGALLFNNLTDAVTLSGKASSDIFSAVVTQEVDGKEEVKGEADFALNGEVEEDKNVKITAKYASEALKVVENLGLMFFVTAVGFIAGPSFVANFKKNFKSYVLLGAIIIAAGAAGCIGCIYLERGISSVPQEKFGELTATMVGVLAGSLTSTPAFSASKGAVLPELESAVSAGYAIAYLFGVVGVVLFVQLIPKLTKADVVAERNKIAAIDTGKKAVGEKKLIELDDFGIMPLSLAIVIGVVIGSVKFGNFSLTTTGGCLLAGLVFGHFGHIGPVSIMPKATTLKALRELGLVFFLAGAGIKGGASFVEYFKPIYFVYGIIITLVPMVIGFIFAKYVLKLPLFNNLGSLTGGMTSTPALGTLINVAGTEDVANAYAATYPVALIAVVLASQLIVMFIG